MKYIVFQPPDDVIVVPLEIVVPGSDWWYFAAYIEAHAPSTGRAHAITSIPMGPTGLQMSTDSSLVRIQSGSDSVKITVQAYPDYADQWQKILTKLQRLAARAHEFRRLSVGQQLKEVLDDYYARKDRGERVKLKALAEASGVNYGSLRQAKFRYEEARRKNVKGD